jgi:cobalamin biosynthesis Mg chelatase CobN
MKSLQILIALLFLISGCSLQKKSIKTDIDTATKTEFTKIDEVKSSDSEQKDKTTESTDNIQNDKNSDYTINTKTTEYYPPEPGSGKEKGAIKSETETSTEKHDSDKTKRETKAKKTDKGKSEAKKDQKSEQIGKEKSNVSVNSVEKSKPSPNRLPWIFGILALVVFVIIYFNKSPFVTRIKSLIKRIYSK